MDVGSLNKRTLENLVFAGAFDCLVPNRAQVLGALDQVIGLANRKREERASGQNDMFSAVTGPEPVRLKPIPDFEASDKLAREHGSIGFYLSAHPLDEHQDILDRMGVKAWRNFAEDVRKGAPVGKVAGTIVQKQERNTKTGNRMAILQVSDPSGQFETVVFSEMLNTHRDLLEPGQSVIFLLAAEDRPEGINVRTQAIEPLDRAAATFKGAMSIFVRSADAISPLKKQLGPPSAHNGSEVRVFVLNNDERREVEIRLNTRHDLSDKLARAIKSLPGIDDVRLS